VSYVRLTTDRSYCSAVRTLSRLRLGFRLDVVLEVVKRGEINPSACCLSGLAASL